MDWGDVTQDCNESALLRVAGGVSCAIPERRISKDPSRYIFDKEALQFDTVTLTYPRLPSWMMFDATLMHGGALALVSASAASYNGIEWDQNNQPALHNGWIVQGATIAALATHIRAHPTALRLRRNVCSVAVRIPGRRPPPTPT